MIFLSIMTKAFALALVVLHPWLAAGLWFGGAALDVWIVRKAAADGGAGRVAVRVAILQAAALVLGWSGASLCDYAAMRWKDGIPVFAAGVDALLGVLGGSAGSEGGRVFLTTMAGPLEFAASIDGMGLKLPALILVMSGTWLLWAGAPVGEALRKAGTIAGILMVVAGLRMVLVILLANGLFEFVGYETEELPWRLFMDEAAGVWLYLLLLPAAGALIGRLLPAPAWPATPARLARVPALAALAAMLALAFAVCWQPAGTPKAGKLVISSYHSQWSRSDRPYDRDWYGADSGYNYACLKRLFETFYQVADAAGPLTHADLEGASTLVVYDPDRRFTKDEIELVQGFVRGGGGLLVIGDHTNVFGSASHLNELCGEFGFQFRDDVLFDLDEDFHQMIDPPVPRSGFWHGMSFFKLRGPASIRPTSVWTRPVYQVGHSKSVRAIYSVNNFYPPPHDDPKMKSGTFCVSAASRCGKGRVAAWADSTVFSNFEIFYPGKYEYLLNVVHWLNHQESGVAAAGRRIAAVLLFAGVAGLLLVRREPRVWLATLTALAASLGAAHFAGQYAEAARATFPAPARPSSWVFFDADPGDPGHHLRGFVTEEPYDQRYEVFIQWVLRTGAFAAYHVAGPLAVNGLYQHLDATDNAQVARALIVRKPADLEQLGEFAAIPARAGDPVLLMFAGTIPADKAADAIKRAGLVRGDDALAKIAQAWPASEAVIEDAGRRVVVVAGAERFSDQAMGISEKVTPDAAQRALFDQAFGAIDRLLGRDGAK